jgi:KipI family sensor histidine kinase inhibitor
MTPARAARGRRPETRAAGDAALLLDAPGGAPRLAAAISSAALPGIVDVVPGAATVLVVTEPGRWDLAVLERRLRALPQPAEATATAAEVEIPVRYDGADLAAVADLTGLTAAEVIERHQAARYRVGWLGFSPGFGYLTGLDPVLAAVPRRATPRASVPAGSVAIAGGLAAVYPAPSPGGWWLLGRTTTRMWDPARQPPALLAPGTPVRFRAIPAQDSPAPPAPAPDPDAPAPDPDTPDAPAPDPDTPDTPDAPDVAGTDGWTGPVEVLRTGPLATIQDLGRPGYAHLGVPRAGAADAASLRRANRLVGNSDGAAGLEVTLGRLQLRFHSPAVVAVTGAPVSLSLTPASPAAASSSPGSPAPPVPPSPAPAAESRAAGAGDPAGVTNDRAIEVPAGAVLRLAAPANGLRSYLAIRGGIDVPPELGSRSADLLSGLGPRPLRPGDRLPVGSPSPAPPDDPPHDERPDDDPPRHDQAHDDPVHDDPARHDHAHDDPVHDDPARADPAADGSDGAVILRIWAGPRDDWFEPAALLALTGTAYRVTPTSNRTGLRLSGAPLPRVRAGELPSEGMITGALQVPPDGQPILLLADHQTTGGYPVLAVVHSADIGRAAQLRPGRLVRFRLVRPGA